MQKTIGLALAALLVLAAWSDASEEAGRCRWDRRAADYVCR